MALKKLGFEYADASFIIHNNYQYPLSLLCCMMAGFMLRVPKLTHVGAFYLLFSMDHLILLNVSKTLQSTV